MKTVDNVQRIADNVRMKITMAHDDQIPYTTIVAEYVGFDLSYTFAVDGRDDDVFVHFVHDTYPARFVVRSDTQRERDHIRDFVFTHIDVNDTCDVDNIVNAIVVALSRCVVTNENG